MKHIYTLFCFIFFSYVAYGQSLNANFSANPTEGCAPMIVNFTDLSLGNPTSWFWDFGNGSTSTLKNPSTSYFNPGSYSITLTVTNANGTHTTTRSNYIVVYNNPVADFNVPVSSGCSPAVLQFNDQSTTQAGTTINSWKWNFGD
ncbi:MAG TPA: PKD domain-containing protein, partial [Chitinophagaceae bacterium]